MDTKNQTFEEQNWIIVTDYISTDTITKYGSVT